MVVGHSWAKLLTSAFGHSDYRCAVIDIILSKLHNRKGSGHSHGVFIYDDGSSFDLERDQMMSARHGT